ncbi:MAG: heme-binding protein [Mycobacterium sp.]|jgi:hemophore-related protein|nr:heme-binding protein [Mycobacterium sp.]MDT5391685.1 heme-binding protein [Mycobacterium sp.]
MLLSVRAGRRVVAGALGAGAIAGAMLVGTIPSALADDPALNPPNCTAGDLAGVASGVSASTSAYLFTHPDVNWFFTSLEGLPRDQVRTKVADYLKDNPTTKDDLTGIRQPLVDLKDRCGSAPAPALP